jgi:hypothetical protein
MQAHPVLCLHLQCSSADKISLGSLEIQVGNCKILMEANTYLGHLKCVYLYLETDLEIILLISNTEMALLLNRLSYSHICS